MCVPEYSVIVPAYEAAEFIGDCVHALVRQTMDRVRYEIIVVDDGSTDGTGDIAREVGADAVVRVEHGGPAAARNAGVAVAQGEIVLFTDADCEPIHDWIVKMTEPFVDPEIVGVKGTYCTRQTAWIARFTQLEYEVKYTHMAGQPYIDFIDTYSAAYRRGVFVENGGFDVIFTTASVEDQEFSFRLARKGYKLVFQPDAVVFHRHNATVGRYWRRKFGIGYWKALLLRWHPDRAAKDSHTPQTLKLQIGLLGLAGIALGAATLWRSMLWAALLCAILFFASAGSFLAYIIKSDPSIVIATPLFLIVRALALGSGLVLGFSRFAGKSSPRTAPISGLNRFLKRVMDLAGSVLGLIVFFPIAVVIGIAVKLDSRGPVFFTQWRAGENGRPFRIFKFRTMIDGAEEILVDLVDLVSLDAPVFKLQNDPRVTRMGQFLRRASLDELPQFWNVLRGDMSLVGPRPEEMRVVQLYNDWHRQRLAIKPGMTGPMQVNGRGDMGLDERIRLEVAYIHNYSIWEDVRILVRTVGAVFSGRGAY